LRWFLRVLADFGAVVVKTGAVRQTAPTPVERTLVCDNRKQLIEVASLMKKFSHRATSERVCEYRFTVFGQFA
jgi:hypothetical protein